MWRDRLAVAALAILVGAAAGVAPRVADAPALRSVLRPLIVAAADSVIPQTTGWELVASRCVICHSLEIAIQQRQGPRGWAEIVDRMISYGAPITPEEREALLVYLLRHFGDPTGR